MKFTSNFNLNLPDLDDMADVEKLNENFQKIDESMKSLETDPELAANVVDIKNKIGEESDADTQPTLFGRLAQLKNVLLEKLAEVLTKVTGIDTKIGTSGDSAGTATLFGRVKDISEKMPTGTVKSIQWGYNKDSLKFPLTISISPVNTEKSIVILNGIIQTGNVPHYGVPVILINFRSNSFTVAGHSVFTSSEEYNAFSWQVIECF